MYTVKEFADSLQEFLKPDESGAVRFGDAGEPLRLSQVEALTTVVEYLREPENISHLVMPGGAGKSRVGTALAAEAEKQNINTLFVVPSQESIRDFSGKARKLVTSLDVGTVYAMEKRIGRLTFITYASLLNCLLGDSDSAKAEAEEFERHETNEEDAAQPLLPQINQIFTLTAEQFRLIIWDEAHKYLTTNAQRVIAKFPHAKNIGMTATPNYYEGKEVGKVFSKKLYELSLRQAIERKEICDFRNILLTTDVVTGVELSSPDQEESQDVVKAIDIPARNKVFADFYKNARIKVGEKEYVIAGEPAIVFGGSIAHVHDLARDINAVLMPALKDDQEFRAALESKGINPDTVEQIAAPIHSGSNNGHVGMDLDARNALVKQYDERKVLIMVATSVLQQSFDNVPTSVVIDSIPRQSYVGVGQTGMRALRFAENKMAFIVNTEDADHQSLTFQDFEMDIGREQGVVVEIGKGKKSASNKKQQRYAPDTSGYQVSYGYELVDLAKRRTQGKNAIYRDDYGTYFRHFTPLGLKKINEMLVNIAGGSMEAVDTLLETLQIWFKRIEERVTYNIFGEHQERVDEQTLEDAGLDTFFEVTKKVQQGAIHGWSRFAAQYENQLKRKFLALMHDEHFLGDIEKESLDQPVKNPHALHENIYNESHDIHATNEPAIDTLHNTLAAPTRDSMTQDEHMELREEVAKMLLTVPREYRNALELKAGLRDGVERTLEEVGDILGITKENVRQKTVKAMKKLRESVSGDTIRIAPAPKEKEEVLSQDVINNRLLWEMEEGFVIQKETIRAIIRHANQDRLANMMGIELKDLEALTDIEWTKMGDLQRALTDEKVESMLANAERVADYIYIKHSSKKKLGNAVRQLKTLLARFIARGGVPGFEEHVEEEAQTEQESATIAS